MKVLLVLTIFVVALSVLEAAKNPDRAARKQAKKEARLARKSKKTMCAPTVTWTACTTVGDVSTMTQTVTPSTNPDCPAKDPAATPVTNTLNCTMVMMKEKKTCQMKKTAKLTPCGTGAETYELVSEFTGCPDRIQAKAGTKSMSCNRPYRVPKQKGDKKGKKGGRNGRGRKNKNKGGNSQQ